MRRKLWPGCLFTIDRYGLAASPSPPGRSSRRVAKPRAEGGEGLANIALDHVSYVGTGEVPAGVEDDFCTLGGIQVGLV